MTLAQIGFTIKVLITLIPFIADLVSKDKIREAGQKEVLQALYKNLDAQFAAAEAAAKEPVDESTDPHNRSRSVG